MKPIYAFSIVFIVLANVVSSQDYVANGSFEIFSACPTELGQIVLADGWKIPPSMNISSPDYFNACAGPPIGVPANLTGYQNAFDGNAYAGIAIHSSIGNYREYIQTQFETPLVAGQQYLVSFRVSAAGLGFSNNIGALVSHSQPTGDGTFHPIDAAPQINAADIIANVTGWTEVSGTYIAAGGEAFLTIGNFFDDAATTVSGTSLTTYYYVDDVSVTPLIMMGLVDIGDSRFVVYPNPFTGQLNFCLPAGQIESIKVHSVYGTVYISGQTDVIDLSYLPSGFYIIAITGKNGKTVTRKIEKE
jgi:hypothetical protein